MPLIDPGRKAPAFSLPDQAGKVRTLADFAGRPLVVYFYPADDTETCTAEACAFRDSFPKFQKVNATVVGISPDDSRSHSKFIAKYKLPFTLLADPPGRNGVPETCDRYGVWQEKTLFGRQYMGVQRTTYLIDREGRVADRWDKVRIRGHAEAILAALAPLETPQSAASGKSRRAP